MNNRDRDPEEVYQSPLFPDLVDPQPQPRARTLALEPICRSYSYPARSEVVEAIPQPILPTRWERLQPQIEQKKVSIGTIIRPVPDAMGAIREMIEYLRTTGGCQILVMRADTGSGKTTFLNTLPHYMHDVPFHITTIELQNIGADEFGEQLWQTQPAATGINLVILEGREKPAMVDDAYIQIVLAHINRFARDRLVPILFVIPTIDTIVARNWCDHGSKLGDLIPEQRLYEGSRWYNFPGVSKSQYIEIVEETVRALNPPHILSDFGVSQSEIESWAKNAQTIGGFIEILAGEISTRRLSVMIPLRGPREHVWTIYCSPNLTHYDHTYLLVNGLVQDEKLKASPNKLIPPHADTVLAAPWLEGRQWQKLVATINFLDIRLIDMPINTVVAAALAYGDESLLRSFKKARIRDYKDQIPEEMWSKVSEWGQVLNKRRLQAQNARDSMERTNLFRLLKGMPAEQQKGGKPENAKVLAQYLHLRQEASVEDLHYYLGLTLDDLLRYHQLTGFLGVETEHPLIQGEPSPRPDVTIHTKRDVYALEFHFRRGQVAASEVARYAIRSVIEKYMKELSHLRSQLEAIK